LRYVFSLIALFVKLGIAPPVDFRFQFGGTMGVYFGRRADPGFHDFNELFP